jgi:deoxyribonuclease-2
MARKCLLLLFVAVISVVASTESYKLSCRNEKTGEELDWYTLYKLPRDTHAQTSPASAHLAQGIAYMFMTNLNQDWTMSTLSMNDSRSINARTLESYYNKSDKSVGYIVYNDNCEMKTGSSSRGHSKGVLMFDEETIVAVIHSVPKYPSASGYKILPGQCIFGQSGFCATLKIDQLAGMVKQLSYLYPHVCDSYIPDHIKANYPEQAAILQDMIDGKRVTDKTETTSTSVFKTAGGEELIGFAKTTYYDEDLLVEEL